MVWENLTYSRATTRVGVSNTHVLGILNGRYLIIKERGKKAMQAFLSFLINWGVAIKRLFR